MIFKVTFKKETGIEWERNIHFSIFPVQKISQILLAE